MVLSNIFYIINNTYALARKVVPFLTIQITPIVGLLLGDKRFTQNLLVVLCRITLKVYEIHGLLKLNEQIKGH